MTAGSHYAMFSLPKETKTTWRSRVWQHYINSWQGSKMILPTQKKGKTIKWIYARQLEKAPKRRHSVNGRAHFAFSDVRRHIAKAVLSEDFPRICPSQGNSAINYVVHAAKAMLRMAA